MALLILGPSPKALTILILRLRPGNICICIFTGAFRLIALLGPLCIRRRGPSIKLFNPRKKTYKSNKVDLLTNIINSSVRIFIFELTQPKIPINKTYASNMYSHEFNYQPMILCVSANHI